MTCRIGYALTALTFLLGTSACESDQSTSTSATTTTTGGSGGSPATGGAGGETTSAGGGGEGATGGAGGAGGQGAQPDVVETARCGLTFDWLPASSVGAVVDVDTPHSTLTVSEALVTQLALEINGLSFGRTPSYETLAHRLVYTTQDKGIAREATTLVIVPQVSQAESFPVLLFHHGTTGLNDMCAPTYGWEDDSTEAYDIALLLSLFASYGYIVVAPDYLGQKSVGTPSPELHPYLVGEATAVASLDAMRAAHAYLPTEGSMAQAGPIALWGASQGGHAAMYTAMFHPFYASELDIRTGVYSVPPSHLEAHMTLGTRDLRASTANVVLFYTALDSWYQPNLAPGLDQIFLSPYDTQLPVDLAADCSPDTLDSVTSVQEVFTTELITASSSESLTGYEPWGCFMRENSVTSTSLPPPTIPGLVVLGEIDDLVWTGIERAAFDTLCTNGHALSYLECEGAGHEEGFFWAIDDMLDYIDDRIAGTPVQDSCVRDAAQTCSNTP